MLLGWLQLAGATVPSLNACPDMVFVDGNENSSVPSGGSGGPAPGSFSRTITVGQNDHTYYLYVPSSYAPSSAMPIMALWHGTAGAGNSPAAAQDMRDYWLDVAEMYGFIVVAQASTGTNGGWFPTLDSQILVAIFNDMDARYNIETSRKYLWGFSGGGHVAHAIAMNAADYFAAYAISAGDLDAFAVPNGYTPSSASRVIPVFVSVGLVDPLYAAVVDDFADFVAGGWVLNRDYWLDEFQGGHILPNHLPSKAWDTICISTNMD